MWLSEKSVLGFSAPVKIVLNHPTQVIHFTGAVPAGFPSPAADYMKKEIDLNDVLVKHPLSTFIFNVEGFSMVNAFIPPKARVIVDRSVEPQNRDIVLAVVNGEFTVKRLQKNEHKMFLLPENNKYKPIEITEEIDCTIWGVVTFIITDAKTV